MMTQETPRRGPCRNCPHEGQLVYGPMGHGHWYECNCCLLADSLRVARETLEGLPGLINDFHAAIQACGQESPKTGKATP